jgi:hypothetical protein
MRGPFEAPSGQKVGRGLTSKEVSYIRRRDYSGRQANGNGADLNETGFRFLRLRYNPAIMASDWELRTPAGWDVNYERTRNIWN